MGSSGTVPRQVAVLVALSSAVAAVAFSSQVAAAVDELAGIVGFSILAFIVCLLGMAGYLTSAGLDAGAGTRILRGVAIWASERAPRVIIVVVTCALVCYAAIVFGSRSIYTVEMRCSGASHVMWQRLNGAVATIDCAPNKIFSAWLPTTSLLEQISCRAGSRERKGSLDRQALVCPDFPTPPPVDKKKPIVLSKGWGPPSKLLESSVCDYVLNEDALLMLNLSSDSGCVWMPDDLGYLPAAVRIELRAAARPHLRPFPKGSAPSSGFGLKFGLEAADQPYFFLVRPDSSYVVWRWIDKKNSVTIASGKHPSLKPAGEYNKLTVEITGTQLRCLANDVELVRHTAAQEIRGKVGIHVDTWGRAAFRDFAVHQLP